MRNIFAAAVAAVLAAAVAAGCDRGTRAPEGQNALSAEAGAPAARGTSGAADPNAPKADAAAPAEPVSGPSAAPAAAASRDEAAPAAAAPRYREVTIPAGTTLSVRLGTAIASDTSRPEQRVDGTLARDVRIGGVEALGAGASLRGIVTNAERSGRVKGRANIAFKFDHITDRGTVYPISTRTIAREAPATKKRDAATIGIPAAGGAIIGGIIGGGDAAVKGGAIGGAAGTAAVLSTRGKEVRLAPGTTVSVRLASPLTVRVAVR